MGGMDHLTRNTNKLFCNNLLVRLKRRLQKQRACNIRHYLVSHQGIPERFAWIYKNMVRNLIKVSILHAAGQRAATGSQHIYYNIPFRMLG